MWFLSDFIENNIFGEIMNIQAKKNKENKKRGGNWKKKRRIQPSRPFNSFSPLFLVDQQAL